VPPDGPQGAPPDVNESDANFTPRAPTSGSTVGDPHVGANVVESIARSRSAKGRFTDFHDFLRKVEPMACNSGSSSR